MKNKVFKRITIICFALMLLLNIISLITAISSSGFFAISNILSNILGYIGSALIIVSLLTAKPVLSIVGFAMEASNTLLSIVGFISSSFIDAFTLIQITTTSLFGAVIDILLMFTVIKPKSAKKLCVSAAILSGIRLAVLIAYRATGLSIVWGLLLTTGVVFWGLDYDHLFKKEPKKEPEAPPAYVRPIETKNKR